jgi:ribonuclease-3
MPSSPHSVLVTEPPSPRRSPTSEPEPVETLEAALEHRFVRSELLRQALTHSSLAHESQDQAEQDPSGAECADNERLEFLGDAVLGMIAAESLYRRYPELPEGSLTRLRGALVSRKHLAEVGRQLNLGKYLLLGRGEERSGGRSKAALLANAMEALLGAVYLDGGLERVRPIVESRIIEPSVAKLRGQLNATEGTGDYKSALQETLQADRLGQPEYRITAETGPDHRKRFFVEAHVAGQTLGKGSGRSRKHAEQDAARQALEAIRHPGSRSAEEAL